MGVQGSGAAGGPGTATLTVTLAREDHVALNLYLSEKPLLWRKRWRIAIGMSVAGILAPWIGVAIGGWPPPAGVVEAVWPISAGMAVLAAAWLLSLPALTRWSLRRQFRFWFAQSGTLLVGRREIEAGADGLSVRGDQGESRFAWSGITAIVETPGHLFLMAGETHAHLIPKRDVADADLRAFLAEVSARTGLPITPARG